jgi:peptidoglycan/xylan/chitin deacetylase (PgdA/CDA1 family)
MSENGITFGSHTCSHINTKVVSDIKLKNELMKSKQKIEHMIKRKIDTFSYPYGIVDGRRCPSMLKECGYKMGFATYRYGKYGSRWAAKRIPIKEQNSIGIFSEFSQSLFEMEYKGYLKEIINYIKLKMNK